MDWKYGYHTILIDIAEGVWSSNVLCVRNFYFFLRVVAPYAGAWIEIPVRRSVDSGERVAPYAGAWINERVPVGAGHLQTFLCERKIYFFFSVC